MIYFSKKDISLIKRTLKYIKPYKIKLILAFFCILSGIGFGILQPLVWGKLVTSLFGKNFNEILVNIYEISFLYLIQALVNFFQAYLFSFLSNYIIFDLKRDMYIKILELPIKAFDEMRVGDFISRLQSDPAIIADIITNQLINTIVDLLKVIIIGITVFSISKLLALIVCVCFPFSYFLFARYGRILREKNKDIIAINDNYFSNIQQSIYGIREIKSLGIQRNTINKFLELGKDLKNKTINLIVVNAKSQTLSQIVNFFSQIAVISCGGYLVLIGSLSMEYFIAFSSYSNQFSNSLMNITKLNSKIQQVLTSLERVFSLLDNLAYSHQKYGSLEFEDIEGIIKFDNVFFKFSEEKTILNGITFEAGPNKKTAIVGNSGSGKTTIFNLLLRFYEPCSGKITIDNIRIENFSETTLRNIISIVRQDVYLFNASIAENLLLANSKATQCDIEKACRASYIHDFIMTLPQKYDSIIEENGINLSGGQRQRLAIARALLRKSKILLFDEATSALDNESEDYIKKAIDEISKNHTVIIIGHRLSSIINADTIVAINKGEVSCCGTHNYLMHINSAYRNMCEKEFDLLNK